MTHRHHTTLRLKTCALALAATTALTATFTACNNSSEIGSSIITDQTSIVVDSSFAVTIRSVENGAVLSRTITQLIGTVNAPDYGYISSQVVTQFMPANVLDTTNVPVENIDSLKLIMQVPMGAWTGDSLAPMGLEIYPLTKQLTTPIYSNFDPTGYYNPDKVLGSLIYNTSAVGQTDSVQKLKYRTLYVKLPQQLGRDLYALYRNDPASYQSPTAFCQHFPGIFIKNTYGSGRITRVANTTMRMYYHRSFKTEDNRDTTVYKIGNYYAVTPEIISNNNISLSISPAIRQRVDIGESILLAPAGLDVEIAFPTPQILTAFKDATVNALGVMNKLSFELPVEDIENKYGITPPEEVLLVLKKDREAFFNENKLVDNTTSFRATYNKYTGSYYFEDMLQYIMDMKAKGDALTPEDYTFQLVPIYVSTETNTDIYGNPTVYVTAITPYVNEPRMCKILPEKAKIKFIYSKQNAKN